MTEKRLSIKMQAEGGDQVRTEFTGIQRAGESAGEAIGQGFRRGGEEAQAANEAAAARWHAFLREVEQSGSETAAKLQAIMGEGAAPLNRLRPGPVDVRGELARQLADIEQDVERSARTMAALFGEAFDPASLPDMEQLFGRMVTGLEDAGGAATDYDRILGQLQSRYDPLAAVTREYGEALENISRLFAAGVIDLEQAQRLTALATETMDQQTKAFERGTGSAGQMREGWRSLSSQLGEAVRAIIAGRSPLEVMSRQLGDVGSATTRLAGSKTAFARLMTGPWGLAVTAGTALLGGLTTKLFENREASESAARAADSFADAQSSLGRIMDLTTGKISTQNAVLRESIRLQAYRDQIAADRAERTAITALREFNRPTAGEAVSLALSGGTRERLDVSGQLRELQRQRAERGPLADVLDDFVRGTAGFDRTIQQIDRLGSSGRLAGRNLLDLREAIVNLGTARNEQESNQAIIDAIEGRGLDSRLRQEPSGSTNRSSGGRGGGASNDNENRELEQWLQRLQGRFDPAAAAAARLREEMQAITRLSAAGLIDAETAAWWREMVQQPENLGEKGAQAAKQAADEAQRRAEMIARINDDMDDQATLAMHELSLVRMGSEAREASVRLVAIELDLRRQLGGELGEEGALLLDKARSLELINEQLREQQQNWDEIVNSGSNLVDTVLNPGNWKNWGDLGRRVLNDLIADFARLAAANPLKNMLFGGGLPTLGRLFGSGGGGGFNFLGAASALAPGAFALGTHNSPAGLAWVAENGPELIQLPAGSKVTPAGETRRLMAANDAGVGAINITYNIDATGADPAQLARLEGAMRERDTRLPGEVLAIWTEARKRNMIR